MGGGVAINVPFGNYPALRLAGRYQKDADRRVQTRAIGAVGQCCDLTDCVYSPTNGSVGRLTIILVLAQERHLRPLASGIRMRNDAAAWR